MNGRGKGPEIGMGLAEPENNRDGPADTVADERGGVALGSERKQKMPVSPQSPHSVRENHVRLGAEGSQQLIYF